MLCPPPISTPFSIFCGRCSSDQALGALAIDAEEMAFVARTGAGVSARLPERPADMLTPYNGWNWRVP